MADAASESGEFAKLAESFVERYQRGERPSIEKYAAEFPHLADQIRDLFPALEVLEELAPDSASLQGPATDADVNLPESIGGYRILREIGRGGMGIVYEAEQSGLRRRVAVKVLPESVRGNERSLERFRREAQSAAALQHPSIVPVYEVGEDESHAYYVMQFVDGQGLDAVLTELQRLRRRSEHANDRPSTSRELNPAAFTAHTLLTGRFENVAEREAAASANDANSAPRRPSAGSTATTTGGLLSETTMASNPNAYFRGLARIGAQTARALEHAHVNGVIHRDIKPSNLLLDSAGNVWVTDFGLAKAEEDGLTQTGDVVGTLRYMAPERFRGWADPRSDVYSMGLTLYEMLTLRTAFETTDRARLMRQIIEVGPPRPRTVDDRIPNDLETVVLKAINREPARRYQTAEEFADDLDRFLDDKPIHARRSTRTERVWRWCRRNPLTALMTGSLILVLMVGFVVALQAAVAFRQLAEDERLAGEQAKSDRQAALDASRKADEERGKAEAARRDALRTLARLKVANGLQAENEGDPLRALAWYAEALDIAAGNEREEWPLRMRLGHLLRSAPRLVSLRHIEKLHGLMTVSPDGRTAVTGFGRLADVPARPPGRLWNLQCGKVLAEVLPPGGELARAIYSGDGRFVAVVGVGNTARVWDARTGRPRTALLDHGSRIGNVRFSPDGRYLATRGISATDPSCRIWRIGDGSVVLNAGDFKETVREVLFSPDGKTLATASVRNSARLWNLETGKPLGGRLGLTGYVRRMTFSPDGRWFAIADGSQTSWAMEIAKRRVRKYRCDAPVLRLRFARDGMRLVTIGKRHVRVWNTADAKPLGRDFTSEQIVRNAFLSADGERLLTIVGNPIESTTRVSAWAIETGRSRSFGEADVPPRTRPSVATHAKSGRRFFAAIRNQTVLLIDVDTGDELPALRLANDVHRIAILAGGRYLVAVDVKSNVHVWETGNWSRIAPPLPHQHRVTDVAFDDASQQRLVTRTVDGIVRTWRLDHTGPLIAKFPQPGDNLRAMFNPNGRDVLTLTSDGNATLWNAKTGRRNAQVTDAGPIRHAAYSPDGTLLATTDNGGVVRLWNAATGMRAATPLIRRIRAAAEIVFSPDSRTLAICDGVVTLYDVHTGGMIGGPLRHGRNIHTAAFDPRGRSILTNLQASAKYGGTLFSVATGKRLRQFVHGRNKVTSVLFSPDGTRVLTTGAAKDGTPSDAILWTTATGLELRRIRHPSGIQTAAFNSDGTQIATFYGNGSARVWRTADGRAVTPPLSHRAAVRTLQFSGDGKLLLTAGDERVVRVWSAATGELLMRLNHPAGVTTAEFGPKFESVLTASADGIARRWNIRTSQRSVSEIVTRARLLSCRRADPTGAVTPLNAAELLRLQSSRQ